MNSHYISKEGIDAADLAQGLRMSSQSPFHTFHITRQIFTFVARHLNRKSSFLRPSIASTPKNCVNNIDLS